MKTYEIHDNGGRPFIAEDHKGRLVVYAQTYDEATDTWSRGGQALDTPYTALHVGTDPRKFSPHWEPKFRGNSLLVHVKGAEYIFIGWKIFSFKAINGEKISTFHSPVGNNDFPYPYAIGEHYVYLPIEEVYVPKEFINLAHDPYAQYYGHIEGARVGSVKEEAKKLPLKMIYRHFSGARGWTAIARQYQP